MEAHRPRHQRSVTALDANHPLSQFDTIAAKLRNSLAAGCLRHDAALSSPWARCQGEAHARSAPAPTRMAVFRSSPRGHLASCDSPRPTSRRCLEPHAACPGSKRRPRSLSPAGAVCASATSSATRSLACSPCPRASWLPSALSTSSRPCWPSPGPSCCLPPQSLWASCSRPRCLRRCRR